MVNVPTVGATSSTFLTLKSTDFVESLPAPSVNVTVLVISELENP